jgi:hypothetical protein
MITKERVKQVVDEVDALDLPDGAHWMLVHERLGLVHGEVFDIIAKDPGFFGAVDISSARRRIDE